MIFVHFKSMHHWFLKTVPNKGGRLDLHVYQYLKIVYITILIYTANNFVIWLIKPTFKKIITLNNIYLWNLT